MTRAAQAWPAGVVAASAVAVSDAVAGFIADVELTAGERGLILEVGDAWEDELLARAADGRAITLLHSDFHLLGNVFFGPEGSRPRVIDRSELKPGLGPHDLAYCLLSAPHDDRATRDLALLRRYWDGLEAAGVSGYSWALCCWDYRFSLLTNLFQAVFQRSAMWFRRTAAVIAAHDARAALTRSAKKTPPHL